MNHSTTYFFKGRRGRFLNDVTELGEGFKDAVDTSRHDSGVKNRVMFLMGDLLVYLFKIRFITYLHNMCRNRNGFFFRVFKSDRKEVI